VEVGIVPAIIHIRDTDPLEVLADHFSRAFFSDVEQGMSVPGALFSGDPSPNPLRKISPQWDDVGSAVL